MSYNPHAPTGTFAAKRFGQGVYDEYCYSLVVYADISLR